MKTSIELDLSKARLVFGWRFSNLVVNPTEAERFDVHAVPVSRIIDECGDSDARWFGFYEEDCMDPPIYLVRARTFEQAYEDFIDSRPEVSLEDLDEEQREELEKSGDLSGYAYDSSGRLVYTEAIMGYEIELKEVTL